MREPVTATQAFELLIELGASPWLLQHHELVHEVAVELCDRLVRDFEVPLDRTRVVVGAALHDAGRITDVRPASHAAGERLLREHGVSAELARCCVSHATWDRGFPTLEELLVALADVLWDGTRIAALEKRVVHGERPLWHDRARLSGRVGWRRKASHAVLGAGIALLL